MFRSILNAILLLALLSIAACTAQPNEHRAEFFVFGTLLEVTIYDAVEAQANEAFTLLQGEFQNMHHEWHAWEPGLLTDINTAFSEGRPATASPAIVEMTRRSQIIEQQSAGRFNPAIGALIRLWGFHTSEYPIEGPAPDPLSIDELLSSHPSSRDIHFDGLVMKSDNPAVQLDFGGIAKGYAIDIACDSLKELGIKNAIINAGGDLRAIGRHGDRAWRVAVRDPAGGIIGTLEAGNDEAIFTSGNYVRFRREADNRYPHILDPRTGWPVDELASVTVAAAEGTLADAAATALIVAGLDEWVDVARALELDQVLLVNEDGQVYLTPQMNERMEFVEGIERQVVRPLIK